MALSVKIESFEGPLDLLLHLIDVNKFNIFDIPIVEITEQYMEYLDSMETEDLNVMSEFLVMAATLLEIKAKMLLPVEVDEEGEEIDPREDLVQKLLEYKMYKYMSYELRDRLSVSGQALYKGPTIPDEPDLLYHGRGAGSGRTGGRSDADQAQYDFSGTDAAPDRKDRPDSK